MDDVAFDRLVRVFCGRRGVLAALAGGAGIRAFGATDAAAGRAGDRCRPRCAACTRCKRGRCRRREDGSPCGGGECVGGMCTCTASGGFCTVYSQCCGNPIDGSPTTCGPNANCPPSVSFRCSYGLGGPCSGDCDCSDRLKCSAGINGACVER